MSVTVLDTHQVVKTLKAAGFSDAQAEAVTQVVRDSQTLDLSSLATKTDLQLSLAAVRADLDLGLERVRSELKLGLAAAKNDLAETKSELIKWTMGAVGLQIVAIIGAVVALLRLGR